MRLRGLLTALVIAVAACTPSVPASGSLVYGLTLAPSGIDPHLNASSELGIPLSSVYDTLVFLDPETGEFVPGLAKDWTISPDGTTYTFHLRRDVTFHDGTRFDAQAVRANIEYTLNPDNHSQKAAFMLGPLDRVETPDDFTAVFVLKEPYAPLLDSLSQVYLGMASPTALEEWGPVDYQFHQVGTGPYLFVEYVPNDRITLQANPVYDWGPSVYQQRRASIQTITFRFFTDAATRALALESGQADIVGEVPSYDAERLTASGDFSLLPVAIAGQPLQFMLNTTRAPTDELAVRQALILGTDRATIVQTIFGSTSPVAQGPLSLNVMPFLAEDPLSDNDPAEAARLLDAAGWTLEEGQTARSRSDQPLQLKIVAPSWGSNPEVAQLLQADWERLGVKVEVETAAGFGPLKEAQATGEYNLIGVNLFGTDPDLLRPFFTTDGTYDWTMIHSSELDRLLLEASQSTQDSVSRAAMYEQVAGKIREQAL
ncbi:MAG: ABC transporter substrate-binding protein, partial [Chloroflexi bacterium]|nr:ABC transporter substrate-binding protein [Chloroflexota bacterium]